MNIYTLISAFGLSLTLILSMLVLFDNKKSSSNRIFALLGFSIIFWITSNILVDLAPNQNLELFFANLAIIWPTFLPIFFSKLIEKLYYSNNKKFEAQQKYFLLSSYFISGIIILLNQTSLNIQSITIISSGIIGYQPGKLYYLLFVYLVVGFSFCFLSLFRVYRHFPEPQKSQAKFILVGSFLTIFLTIITNVIFPLTGYSAAAELGPSTVIFFVAFTAFAIMKHKLFTIKVIAIEIVIFGLWITILIRTLLAQDLHEAFIEGGQLAITIVLGVLLIRSVLHEITQRDVIQKLTAKLSLAYENLQKADKTSGGK